MRKCSAVIRLLFTVPLSTPLACLADDSPPVTPYRPSVSSPAALPAAGQLELELGGLSQRDHGSRRNSLPYALKFAFNPEWGVVFSGEAWISQRSAGLGVPRERGFGDDGVPRSGV